MEKTRLWLMAVVAMAAVQGCAMARWTQDWRKLWAAAGFGSSTSTLCVAGAGNSSGCPSVVEKREEENGTFEYLLTQAPEAVRPAAPTPEPRPAPLPTQPTGQTGAPSLPASTATATPVATPPAPIPIATPTLAAHALPAPGPGVAAPPLPGNPAAPVAPPSAPVVVEDRLVLRGVHFGPRSSDLDDSEKAILGEAAVALKAHPEVRIYVKGYCAAAGDPAKDQGMSQERAATVAAYLESKGVPLSQMIVIGMGASHFVAKNNTPEGRASNRRVELEPVMEQP